MQITNQTWGLTRASNSAPAVFSDTDAPPGAAVSASPAVGGGRTPPATYDYGNLARGDIMAAVDRLYPEGAPLGARTFRIVYPDATFNTGPEGGIRQAGPADQKIDFVAHLRREAATLAQRGSADERRQAAFITDMLARIHSVQTARETPGARVDVKA